MLSITIKELHQTTGECVRRAGASRSPVAVLASPSLLKPKWRKRTLLPEYKALIAKAPNGDTMDNLNSVRGNR